MNREPVFYNIEKRLENKELDCMSCLEQVMNIFAHELDTMETMRIAEWFRNKYIQEATKGGKIDLSAVMQEQRINAERARRGGGTI